MRRLAYLFPAFPVLHQTFTLGEVVALKNKGYDLQLVSLKRSDNGPQQSAAAGLVDETDYCPRLLSAEMLGHFFSALRQRPGDVMSLARDIVRAWRTRDQSEITEDKTPTEPNAPSTLSFYERLLAVYHHNAYVYLAKSLVLVPYAIYIANRLKQFGVGHLHAHWATYPATVAYLVKRWSGIPYSFTAHAYDIYMISRMLPVKLEHAEFVVTCAGTNRDYLASLCRDEVAERIYVNYHGTDLARFSPTVRQRTDHFRIVTCGWLKEYKGFHYLLDAVALLVRRGHDVTLDIAGDGPQRPYLDAKTAELELGDRIKFHGYLGHEELAELYCSVDVFALPSIVMGRYGRQDVIPNVLAEAMAVGLPVVGSRIGGVSELIDDGENGLLVRERDVEGLADALERLWLEPKTAERFALAGREKVETIWDRNKNINELAGIINVYVPDQRPEMAA